MGPGSSSSFPAVLLLAHFAPLTSGDGTLALPGWGPGKRDVHCGVPEVWYTGHSRQPSWEQTEVLVAKAEQLHLWNPMKSGAHGHPVPVFLFRCLWEHK